MMYLNEKHGYISKEEFNINYISQTIKNFLLNGNSIWENYYNVNGKKLGINNSLKYKTFKFKLNNDLIKNVVITVVKILKFDNNVQKEFPDFYFDNAKAFYSTVNSNLIENQSIGYIYINANYFYNKYTDESMLEDLQETLYHELRHYYDNRRNVLTAHISKINELDELFKKLDISINDIIYNINKNKNNNQLYKLFDDFIYVLTPTEINGWYHSLTINIENHFNLLKDKKEFKNFSNYQIFLKIVEDKKYNKPSYFLYNINEFIKTKEKYKKTLKYLMSENKVLNIELALYYIYKTLNTYEFSDKQKKIIMDKFNYYIDLSVNTDFILKEYIENFLDSFYIDFVYDYIFPKYYRIYKNIHKFIVSL